MIARACACMSEVLCVTARRLCVLAWLCAWVGISASCRMTLSPAPHPPGEGGFLGAPAWWPGPSIGTSWGNWCILRMSALASPGMYDQGFYRAPGRCGEVQLQTSFTQGCMMA